MEKTEIHDALTALFHDIFMRDDITLTDATTAHDIEGWDSFKQIEIIMAVEERFAIKCTTKELDNLQKVGDLADLVLRKTSALG
jgi:acyl carrier protein